MTVRQPIDLCSPLQLGALKSYIFLTTFSEFNRCGVLMHMLPDSRLRLRLLLASPLSSHHFLRGLVVRFPHLSQASDVIDK